MIKNIKWNQFPRAALDALYPRRCPVCGEIVTPKGRLICPSCLLRLSPVKSPVCQKCGKEVWSEEIEYCPDCVKHRRSFARGMALFNYTEEAARSMTAVKYKNKREYLDFYGAALAARYEKQIRRMHADVLVPVPVHPSRKRARGFNQGEVLAVCLEKRLGIPVGSGMLIRDKKTKPQKELSAADRLKNLSGAFRAGTIPEGIKTVLLVDDIYTTGSTVEACARALRNAGVSRVYFVVICMTGGR